MGEIADLYDWGDPNDWDEQDPRPVKCKYCGREGLHWESNGHIWLLLDGNGRKHECRRRSLKDIFRRRP